MKTKKYSQENSLAQSFKKAKKGLMANLYRLFLGFSMLSAKGGKISLPIFFRIKDDAKGIIGKFKNMDRDMVFYKKGNNTSFSFNPFKILQGVAVLTIFFLLFFTAINFFTPKYSKFLVKNISLLQMPAEVGNVVHWSVIVKRSDIQKNQYYVKLPKNATNITIKTVTPQKVRDILARAKIKLQSKPVLIALENKKVLSRFPYLGFPEEPAPVVPVPPEVVLGAPVPDTQIVQAPDNQFVDVLPEALPPVQTPPTETPPVEAPLVETPPVEVPPVETPPVETPPIEVPPSTENPLPPEDPLVQIDYETPAPAITEQLSDTGKEVTVSVPDIAVQPDLPPPKDVLAFTNIPEIFKVGQENKIQIKWKNNGNQDVQFNAYDLNGNGKLDYVEWTVPHLSDQVFDVIFISKAFELDQNQNIITDIYDTVKSPNQTYATVPQGNYIRVTFEKILNNTKDITLYAKPTGMDAPSKIEVYPVYTNADGNQTEGDLLVPVSDGNNPTFDTIDHDGKYRILLANLANPTDLFDLKVINTSVDVDFIVDPSTCTASATGNWSTAATWGNTCNGGGANGYPGALNSGDTVVINANVTVTYTATLPSSFTIAQITFNDPAATGANILNINTATVLTTTGDVIFAANTGAVNQTIQMHGTGILNVGGALNMGNVPTGAGSALITTSVATACSSCQVNVTGLTTLANAATAVAGAAKITMTTGATAKFTTGTLTYTTTTTGTGVATLSTATGTIDINGAVTFTGATAARMLFNITGAGITDLSNVTLPTGGTVTLVATSTTKFTNTNAINGAYTFGIVQVNSGTTTLGAVATTFTGTTTLSGGTLAVSSATGTKTFTGAVTCTTGSFDFSGFAAVTSFAGGITANCTTFKTGTGTTTLSATQALAGSTNITFGGALTVSAGTTTNNNTGTVTVTGVLTLTGNWIQGANSLLTLTSTNAGAGALNASTNTPNTITYTSTATLKAPTVSYYNLTISAGTVTTVAVVVANNLVVSSGATLSGTTNVTVNGGNVTGDGTVTMTGGTFLVDGTGNFGGATAWTFFNLTFGDGSVVTTTTATGAGAITVTNLQTVAANQTLNAGSKTWNLTGAIGGATLTVTGTFTASTSTINFQSNNDVTVPAITYYNLTFSPTITSGHTYLFASGTTTVGNNLDIVPTAGSVLALTAWSGGTTLTVTGSVTVERTGSATSILELTSSDFTATGATNINSGGTLSDNTATGTNIFIGLVTVNNGGGWTDGNNSDYTLRGGLSVNTVSTFTSGAGNYIFNTNAQTISGTQSFTITNITNNITTGAGLTFSGAQPTVTTLTQGTNAQLTFSGSLPTITTLTASASGNTVSYTSTAVAQTVIPTLPYFNLTIDKTGQTATLGADTIANGTIKLTSGILDANNLNVTADNFSSSNSNNRTLTMGSGTWTLRGNSETIWDTSISTNFTINRGSAIVANYSGSSGTRTINGSASEATSPDFNITDGTDTVAVAAGVHDLNFTGVPGFTGILSNDTRTIYGNFTLNDGMTTMVGSNVTTFGSTTGIKNITGNGGSMNFPATIDGSGAKLQTDVIFAGVVTLTRGTLDISGHSLNALSFLSSNSNTRTLNMTTGILNIDGNAATIWDTSNSTNFTLNGSPASVYSGNGSVGTRTINSSASEATSPDFVIYGGTDTVAVTGGIHNIDFIGFTGTLSNDTRTIYGNLTLYTGMTLASGANVTTFAATSGTKTITNSGKTENFPLTFNGVGGTWQLADNMIVGSTRTVTLTNGTFSANGKNITMGNFSSSNSNTRVITMGIGTWTLFGTGTVWDTSTTTGLTLNQNTSTIKFTDNSNTANTFSGGGKTYNNIWLSRGASTASNTIVGSNTFTDFKDDGTSAHSILFTTGTTQTVTTFTVSGTSGNLISIDSTTTGTHTLSKASGTVSSDYLNIQHSIATGGATWNAGAHSTNNQGVATAGSGWVFSGVPNTLPVASSVNIDSGAATVNLIEGTTKNVVCTAVVTDADGFADITSVQAVVYRTGVGAGAGDNNANHYTKTGDAQCIPSGGSGNTENYTCTFAVQFYADATDTGSPNAADNWTCQVTPTDTVGAGTASTHTIEMNSLTALDVTATIAYGSLALGADTGSTDQTTIVTNTGNRQIDTQLDGYGAAPADGFSMACVIGKVVLASEKYSATAATAYASKTALSGTPTTLTLTLAQGLASTKNVYWGFGLPSSGVGGVCTGKVNFTAVNG